MDFYEVELLLKQLSKKIGCLIDTLDGSNNFIIDELSNRLVDSNGDFLIWE